MPCEGRERSERREAGRERRRRTGAIHSETTRSCSFVGAIGPPALFSSAAAIIAALTPPQPVCPARLCQLYVSSQKHNAVRTTNDDGFDLENVHGVTDGSSGGEITFVKALSDVAL